MARNLQVERLECQLRGRRETLHFLLQRRELVPTEAKRELPPHVFDGTLHAIFRAVSEGEQKPPELLYALAAVTDAFVNGGDGRRSPTREALDPGEDVSQGAECRFETLDLPRGGLEIAAPLLDGAAVGVQALADLDSEGEDAHDPGGYRQGVAHADLGLTRPDNECAFRLWGERVLECFPQRRDVSRVGSGST